VAVEKSLEALGGPEARLKLKLMTRVEWCSQHGQIDRSLANDWSHNATCPALCGLTFAELANSVPIQPADANHPFPPPTEGNI